MEISPKVSVPSITLTLPQKSGNDLSFLKPGMTVSATVQTTSDDGMTLQINERLVKISSDLSFAQGTKLSLRVEVKDGQAVLRLMPPQQGTQDTQQQALRQLLPKQLPLQQVFKQLGELATRLNPSLTPARSLQPTSSSLQLPARFINYTLPGSHITIQPKVLQLTQEKLQLSLTVAPLPRLPVKVEQALGDLLQRIPSAQELTVSDGLKKAISNSGLFLEHHLVTGSEPAKLQGDLKTLLLRLAFIIRQTLGTETASSTLFSQKTKRQAQPSAPQTNPQGGGTSKSVDSSLLQLLGRQSESALARLQVLQLNALTTLQHDTDPALSFELPVFNGKENRTLELTISRDKHRNGESDTPCWSVRLKLDSEDYGAVTAILSLIGKQISTTFWCEQEETRARFHNHINVLCERIKEQGLELGKTQAFTGMPPDPDGPDTPNTDGHFISVQA